MTDVLTPSQRSYCMSRIRGKDTLPEKQLRSALWHLGLRFRTQFNLPGKPDIVFTRARLAVFVDGCFWHSCPDHCTKPKKNSDFWARKLARTMERDKWVSDQLRADGWNVVRIWEHRVKDDVLAVAQEIAMLKRKIGG